MVTSWRGHSSASVSSTVTISGFAIAPSPNLLDRNFDFDNIVDADFRFYVALQDEPPGDTTRSAFFVENSAIELIGALPFILDFCDHHLECHRAQPPS
jgi:hypothetical protein